MKILYLLRHAKSSWKDPSLEDFDRPLNGRGKRAAKRMGGYLDAEGLHPAAVLCSAAARTRQTLDLVQPALGDGAQIKVKKSLYLASPSRILEVLGSLEDSVPSAMVIAHNPGIQELALSLTGSAKDDTLDLMKTKFPTAALAMLTSDAKRWSDLEPGTLHLEAFVRPKDLDPL